MRPAPIAIVLAAAALSGCHATDKIAVGNAWVRLPAVPGRPAAAYFTLTGGSADATLTGVSTASASRAEMHETMDQGNMSTMTPIDSVPLQTGSEVRFAPGGRHVMLFDLKPGITPGDTVPLTLRFADGKVIETSAVAVAAGAPSPFAEP